MSPGSRIHARPGKLVLRRSSVDNPAPLACIREMENRRANGANKRLFYIQRSEAKKHGDERSFRKD